jgi:DNA repair protein RecO (recombination protein O)
MMLRVQLEPAYVLHGRPYRESSLLLEVMSRSQGRTGLVARGARGSRSRWKNLLQPFRPLLLSWNQRGELGTLTAAEQVASMPLPRGDALFCGFYVNELLLRALHRSDPHESLFESYRQLLVDLASQQAPQPLLRVFERDLLEAVGFGLQLGTEHGSGAPVDPAGRYRYVPGTGPVRIDTHPAAGVEDSAILAVSGEALLALQSTRIEERHLAELKSLMRQLLQYHFGDKPLVSQALFR